MEERHQAALDMLVSALSEGVNPEELRAAVEQLIAARQPKVKPKAEPIRAWAHGSKQVVIDITNGGYIPIPADCRKSAAWMRLWAWLLSEDEDERPEEGDSPSPAK